MKHVLLTLIFIAALSSGAFAQAITDPACLQKLSDPALYKKHKKESYALLTTGTDGWLFRSRSDFKEDFSFTTSTISGFVQLSKALKTQGTELVIAFPPTRGIVAAEHLPENTDYDPVKALASYEALITAMQENGVHFVGVPDSANKDGFFRKADHHWTVNGARQMAQNVANAIKADIPIYEDIEKKPFETITSGSYAFKNRFGDVVEKFCDLSVPDGSDDAVSTSLKGQGASDLFGDEAPPSIVLVGTSNSKADHVKSNFDGALRDFLQADVLNEAMSGAGFDHPLLAFLASERFQTDPPKIIIWEIPGYYMLKGMSEFFNQAISMSAGDCGDGALASFGPITLGQKKMLLKNNLVSTSLINGRDYLYLDFDQPVKKKFGIKFGYNDKSKSQKNFKFKHSKHYPNDGKFFVTTPVNKRDLIDELSIRIPEQVLHAQVEGRFCRLPKGVTGIKY